MSAGIIAVIDDNATWIDTVSEVLTDEGFEVHAAANGEQAVDLLDSVRPSLIILDVHLPGTSGLRILSEYRKRDRTTPILVISGDDRTLVRDQAMSDGASGFLQKPITSTLLLRAVRRFVGRDPHQQAPRPNCEFGEPSLN